MKKTLLLSLSMLTLVVNPAQAMEKPEKLTLLQSMKEGYTYSLKGTLIAAAIPSSVILGAIFSSFYPKTSLGIASATQLGLAAGSFYATKQLISRNAEIADTLKDAFYREDSAERLRFTPSVTFEVRTSLLCVRPPWLP